MNQARRATWDERHRGTLPGDPEPSVLELLPLATPGLALDVGSGTGRNSIALARAGWRVIAADFSFAALSTLNAIARRERLAIDAMVADLEESFPFRRNAFDLILNVSYLDRALVPAFKTALRPGGTLLFDTFLIDEAVAGGHLHDTRFTLDHYELRTLLEGFELIRYREGLVAYPNGKRAWRATALARLGT